MNKQVFHFFLLLLLSTNAALAQNYEWTWMHGYNRPALYPDYGTQGVASSSNIPGGREGAVYWTDASGKFWLFGGNGYPQNRTNALNLNDLWKFDPATGQWTWMKGDVGDVTHGVYGTQGVANAANKPGKRHSAMGWRDAAGNLWLFGGNGYASTGGTGRLNDLWKYDIGTNMWTWIDGDNIINQHGVYGTLGTSAATNKPGGRTGAATWVDATGDLWLFGGNGYATAGGANVLNDLWRYDIVSGEWTWMAGANTTTQFGVYGTLGVSDANNKPGAREGAVAWTDNTGNLWLLGGIGLTTSAIGRLNDLWKFDIATGEWTWMNGDNTTNQLGIYGTLGTSSATNKPGARCYAICWKDASGDFWIFGGDGFASVGGNSMLSDLWKYDVSANEWTWMKGPDVSGQYAVYGTQGVANAANTPGGKQEFGGWIDVSGNLWLFGGEGLMAAGGDDYSSDMWKYDVGASNWTWVDGDRGQADPGVYGALGTSAPANTPSARLSGTTWKDNAGNLWLFGGQGVASDILMGKLNDLWKYDVATGQWAWMNGDNIAGQVGVHGTLGVMAPGNKPGARSHAAGWKDNSGNLWLYGGDANGGNLGNRNDLWKYDITADQWTWMRGDDIVDLPGIYGTLGTPAPANQPGARVLAATWKDGNGNLWMFGGFGIDIGTTESELNDLWKYDVSTNEWTWMHGDNIIDQFGVYGTQGTAAPANKPGARNGAVSWTDTSGNFWLFGGFGFGETGAVGMLNDLWKYDVTSNQWAWMKGDKTPGHYGVYGTIGVAAATNLPGSRGSAVSWVDTSNNLCMIGGFAWPSAIPAGRTNDVWKYNISSNEWTWLDGSNMADPLATYGILGTPAPANIPGGRVNAMSWADSTGVVWMFGGEGLGVSGVSYMNDLWRYAIDTPVSVKMLNKQLQSGHISVYPNPITGSGSQLSIHALQKGSYTLSLYSSNGQLIYSRPLNHDGKNTTIDFILPAGISTGVYNVVLSGKDTRLSESILIKR